MNVFKRKQSKKSIFVKLMIVVLIVLFLKTMITTNSMVHSMLNHVSPIDLMQTFGSNGNIIIRNISIPGNNDTVIKKITKTPILSSKNTMIDSDISNISYITKNITKDFNITTISESIFKEMSRCDKIFTNAYNKHIIQCNEDKSSFNCYMNSFTKGVFCSGTNMILDNTNILLNGKGGEPIDAVLGRKEGDELPIFKDNSIHTECTVSNDINAILPKKKYTFYLYDMIQNIKAFNKKDIFNSKYNEYCGNITNDDSVWFITTRYDYANIFLTSNDWFNAYAMLDTLDIELNQIKVLFLDAHSWSPLDDSWKIMFKTEHQFIKHLSPNLCLKKYVLLPSMYAAGLSHMTDTLKCNDKGIKQIMDFKHFILNNVGVNTTQSKNIINIGLICRKGYLSHPRNSGKNIQRQFVNDTDIQNRINNIVNNTFNELELNNKYSYNIKRIYLEDINITTQIHIISKINILIGVHGAGLTHLMFLQDNGSSLIEIQVPKKKGNKVYKKLSTWFDVEHIELSGRFNTKKLVTITDEELIRGIKIAILKYIGKPI